MGYLMLGGPAPFQVDPDSRSFWRGFNQLRAAAINTMRRMIPKAMPIPLKMEPTLGTLGPGPFQGPYPGLYEGPSTRIGWTGLGPIKRTLIFFPET